MYSLSGFRAATLLVAAMTFCGVSGVAQAPQTPAVPDTAPTTPGQVQTFNGTLVDSECKALQNAAAGCEVTAITRAFGLQLRDGTVFRFDQSGSDKVRAALQSGPKQPGPVTCTVRGAVRGGVLIVQSIEIPQA